MFFYVRLDDVNYIESIVMLTSLCENSRTKVEVLIEEQEHNTDVRNMIADVANKYDCTIRFEEKINDIPRGYVKLPTNMVIDGDIKDIYEKIILDEENDNICNYAIVAVDAHNDGLHYSDIKGKEKIILFRDNRPWQCADVHYDIEKIWWDYAGKTRVYHQLMELFLENSMADTSLEDYAIQLADENEQLAEALKDAKATLESFINNL